MSKYLAFLFGFTMVVAHVPVWSQPSIEPKSALLLGAGALAWGWLAWKGRPAACYPWALVLPLGWLLVSASWSPAPFLGLQRVIWLLAAMGLGSLLTEEDDFHAFMLGFLAGTGVHATVIVLQWIPPVRALLPHSLGADAFQGIGRGLFHNTNMAALPFVILVAWLLLAKHSRHWMGHLLWLLPILALTQSRLGIGVCSGLLAFAALREFIAREPADRSWLQLAPLVILALAWGGTAHRWGWLLPVAGLLAAWLGKPEEAGPLPQPRPISKFLPVLGLTLAVLSGLATRAPKNAAQTVVQGTLIQGDASWSQRSSYYRVAALAFLDRPFTGQGLGAARPIYPQYVDRNHPAAEIAYGDFQRPNNFHSEPLEWLAEGGLPLVLLLGFGLWLDRQGPDSSSPRSLLLLPLAVIALLDFPFHNPLGLLWVGLTLGVLPSVLPGSPSPKVTRVVQVFLGVGLLALAGLQVRVAQTRQAVERQYLARHDALHTHTQARELWQAYPFSADLFDLYSKSAIQAASTSPSPEATQELDELLQRDPFDHHLLLARAQLARRAGDVPTVQALLVRYSEVAPLDPERFLRLAQDAFQQGKPEATLQLLGEAGKQPGFNPTQQQRVQSLREQIALIPR